MKEINITTRYISSDGLTARRQIQIGDKIIETPTVATPIGRATNQDSPAPESRGVNELYRTLDTESIAKSMRETESRIAKAFERDYKRTKADELTVAFVSYKDGHRIAPKESKHIVDIIKKFSDIIPVPMMPDLVGTIDTETNTTGSDSAYLSYKKSVQGFLDAADERAPNMPVMGMIPPLGWEYVQDIISQYSQYGIRAFCFNFNRRRATAARQVAIVSPLMRHLARRDIAENVMIYAINPDPYGQALREDIRPAADLSGLGMGLDIIGDCHISPGGFDEESNATSKFKLFDKDTFVYRDIPINELDDHLPSDTGLNHKRIISRCQKSPENGLYKMQKLLNMEQMALAAKEIQTLSQDEMFEYLSGKAGITNQTKEVFQKVRSGFENGSSQTGLSDF